MSGGSGYIGAFDNTGNWELTADVKFSGDKCGVGVIKSDETSRDNNEIMVSDYRHSLFAYVNGTSTSQNGSSSNLPSNTWYSLKMTKNGTTMSATINNVNLSLTWSLATSLQTLALFVDSWGNATTIKNVQIKPL